MECKWGMKSQFKITINETVFSCCRWLIMNSGFLILNIVSFPIPLLRAAKHIRGYFWKVFSRLLCVQGIAERLCIANVENIITPTIGCSKKSKSSKTNLLSWYYMEMGQTKSMQQKLEFSKLKFTVTIIYKGISRIIQTKFSQNIIFAIISFRYVI